MGSSAGKMEHKRRENAYTREAYHAGSWYDKGSKKLDETLSSFLEDTSSTLTLSDAPLRGLIVPHAGYSYSGPTAAFAFAVLRHELQKSNSTIRRILVLHPSHHVYLDGCAVSGADVLETPVGNLKVDDELRQSILSLPHFSVMKKNVDEEEHSGEMQYPYLAKILKDSNRLHDVTVLPVMCGALSNSKEESYGKALAAIITREDVCTVVSSDFCHWGSRFSYQPMPDDDDGIPIHEFIQRMDQRGMDLIEMKEPGAFAAYLKETRNTICGRHAIAVWMHATAASPNGAASQVKVEFIRYAQSSAVQSWSQSSVSYAAARATLSS